MRTKRYYITLMISVISCSLLLTSCEAITAQNITSADFNSRPGGFPGMRGGTGSQDGGGRGMDRGGQRWQGGQVPDRRAGSPQ